MIMSHIVESSSEILGRRFTNPVIKKVLVEFLQIIPSNWLSLDGLDLVFIPVKFTYSVVHVYLSFI